MQRIALYRLSIDSPSTFTAISHLLKSNNLLNGILGVTVEYWDRLGNTIFQDVIYLDEKQLVSEVYTSVINSRKHKPYKLSKTTPEAIGRPLLEVVAEAVYCTQLNPNDQVTIIVLKIGTYQYFLNAHTAEKPAWA
ncbi:MAG: hypothetical protein OXR68_06965 [Alphaproteobacteria bacterium]|nr:hypothetical protein [Alphaproteobacteria bacterium]